MKHTPAITLPWKFLLHRFRFALGTILAGSLTVLGSSCLLAQGALTPPGAPAPTMKTLDQLEPRTPIATAPFTISASGSYYLAGNLSLTTGTAITINADNVTLDLNGFTISSTASPATGTAVLLNGVRRNVTVRNGHITSTTTASAGVFTTGGFLDGISNGSTTSVNLRVSEVSISGVGDGGIDFLLANPLSRNVIERCSVSICGGIGLRAGRVRQCDVDTAGSSGIITDIAESCFGETVSPSNTNADGISATSVADNCIGTSVVGQGIDGSGSVTNSKGTSTSGIGLRGTLVTNSEGTSTSGSIGLQANGTAQACRGRRDGGVAINAPIAIGCTVLGTGTVTSAGKFNGTP